MESADGWVPAVLSEDGSRPWGDFSGGGYRGGGVEAEGMHVVVWKYEFNLNKPVERMTS